MPTRTRKLDTRDIRVLIALEKKPLGTYQDLADETGYSKSAVHGIVKHLAYPEDRPYPYFTVTAHPNLKSLGLEVVDVIVPTPSLQSLIEVLKVGNAHPYTIYQAFIYGKNNGVYNQFRIPIGTKSLIDQLFKNLQTQGKIDSYELYQYSMGSQYTSTEVNKWDTETNSWNFSWKEWFTQSIDIDPTVPVEGSETLSSKITDFGNAKEWIRCSDLAILAELTNNSRRKNTEFIEALKRRNVDFTPQTFGRHLNRIQEECVEKYRVFFHGLTTEPFNPILIRGTSSTENIQDLVHRLRIDPLPFNSTFKHSTNAFSWFLQLPSSHIYPLLPRLQKRLTSMDFYYVDAPNANAYTLVPSNFDEQAKDWRRDEDLMVHNVLQEIEDPEIFHPHQKEKLARIFGQLDYK